MPSYAHDSSYASASSSRHPDHGSSHSSSSTSDRHPEDAYRRPRSPEPRYRNDNEDPDHYRPSHRRYDDDDRHSSHYSSRSSRYAEEPDRYDSLSRRRDDRHAYSPPSRDRYDSARDRDRDRRYDDSYDRHAIGDYASSRGSRHYDSADIRRDRTDDRRDRWDADLSREAARMPTEYRDTRRKSLSDDAHAGSDRHKGRSPDRHKGRSPDRSRNYRHAREADRRHQNGDYRASSHRDDRRESRCYERSRTRSRSTERLQKKDSRTETRPPSTSKDQPTIEPGELIEDNHHTKSRQDTKLLKRKVESDAPASTTTQTSRPREKARNTVRRDIDGWDDGEDRLEKLASETKASSEMNGIPAKPSGDARQSQVNGVVAAEAPRPTQANGHTKEAPQLERALYGSKQRRRSRSPPSSKTSASKPSAPIAVSSPSASSKQAPVSTSATASVKPAEKVSFNKQSFGHVLLPHELPAELRAKNYMAMASYKSKVETVFKTAAEVQGSDTTTEDPRQGKRPHPRDMLRLVKFVWDANSVGNKPRAAPRNLVLTNLSGLMQQNQLLLQIRPFGRIESSKLEMDPKIGQSLGIFLVTFAHDFDEQDKVVETAAASGQTPQHGAKAAKAAQIALNGRQMGPTRVQAFLDRDGEILAEKVKEKIAANEAKLRPPLPSQPTPAARVSASPATPSASKPNMPPPEIPRGPRASMAATAPSPRGPAASPSVRPSSDRYDSPSSQWSFSRYASSAAEARPREKPSSADPYNRRRDADEYNSHPSRASSSRLDERSVPASPSRAEPRQKREAKLPTQEILNTLRKTQNPYIFIPKPKSCNIETEDIRDQLDNTPPRWTREGDAGWFAAFDSMSEAKACKIVNETLTVGGYTLQVDVRSAPPRIPAPKDQKKPYPAAAAPPTTNGARAAQAATSAPLRKVLDTGLRPLTAEEKQKTEWTATELQDAVFRMLQKQLADTLVRDVKSRLVAPHVNAYLKPQNEGGQILAKAVIKKPVVASRTVDRVMSKAGAGDEAGLPSFRKVVSAKPQKIATDAVEATSKAKRDTAVAKKDCDQTRKTKDRRARDVSASEDENDHAGWDAARTKRSEDRTNPKAVTKKRRAAAFLLDSDTSNDPTPDDAATDAASRSVSASVEPTAAEQKDDGDIGVESKKKSKAKAEPATKKKGAAAANKGTKASATPTDLDVEMDEGEGTATPETEVPTKSKAKQAKASAKVKSIPADPFEAGIVQDEEDLYYLRMVLERIKNDIPITEDEWADEVELELQAEDADLAAGLPPKHSTGSARTEGMYRIAPEHKAAHLPDRNKATEESDSSNAQVLQSARNNRADSRRLVLGIEQHKRETATDTDIFKFNQLRTRKKQLKFAKSPIHDWGLYAMEFIPAGDMVIEYVGEVVRQQVADEREKAYERGGNFSTYLFRVDDDLVVDATHKGNIARLMNHCCTPNCNAKILTLNGEKRIVLFAKSPIRAGEELTYDYKFQSSADDEDAIPCLCGSAGCRRFL